MKYRRLMLVPTLGAGLLLTACENLPGSREDQSTAAGGAAGAAVGAALSDENRLLGALLGGAAGAAGGRLLGARTDWFEQDSDMRQSSAETAIEEAQRDPASAADVAGTFSADLNDDGFVTTDELLAMEEAGLSDEEIIDRLQATDQVFELSEEQRERFVAEGLSPEVLRRMEDINRDQRDELLSRPEVLGSPA